MVLNVERLSCTGSVNYQRLGKYRGSITEALVRNKMLDQVTPDLASSYIMFIRNYFKRKDVFYLNSENWDWA